jgi:hypothetical protein
LCFVFCSSCRRVGVGETARAHTRRRPMATAAARRCALARSSSS